MKTSCAALDVGSNTVRLLVAKPDNGGLEQIVDRSVFVRLGSGVDNSGRLDPRREEAAIEAIRQLSLEARRLDADPVLGIATSAVRDASNAEAFLKRVQAESGVVLEIISGEREAELTYLGATLGLDVSGDAIICDLGGGSTELIGANPAGMQWGRSLAVGSGRLSERFIKHDPPTGGEREELERFVKSQLDTLPAIHPELVVFTGGTASNTAGLAEKSGTTVVLSQRDLTGVIDLVCSEPADELVQRYGVRPERAQVLPAGVLTLGAIASYYGAQRLTITQHGIREGTIVDFLRRSSGATP